MADPIPLIICMENTAGEDVTLRVEPQDDFQTFLDKAKALLGYEVDINSVTKNQPVSLTDNIYQFLINSEPNLTTETEITAQNLEQMLPSHNENDDLVYILDDGTQIRASQIHFDNEDPLVDLTVEKLPFVKYADDGMDDSEIEMVDAEIKTYNIVDSPVSKWSSNKNGSPKCSFVNSLPFKLIGNNYNANFEAQFIKYLEANTSKSFSNLANVNRTKSPRNLVTENYKRFEDNYQVHRNTDDFTHYTREEILNMFKDSPVASLPYENQGLEKRKHARKSDPSRLYKNWTAQPMTNEKEGILIGDSDSQNCFICKKYVDNQKQKLYLFDKEDQRMHRSSPQKKSSTKLKIICEQCLEENFKPCRMKSPNQSLTPDEYLVIRNNQQYIFQKTGGPYKFRANNRTEVYTEKERTEFVKVEIGSDGEIVTKPIDNDVTSDDVIIVKDEGHPSGSSDVEIIENGTEADDIAIDCLEEADEDVIAFLGKYQSDNVEIKELKCRFCERVFANIEEVMDHGETHKHVMDEEEVYPCPLCDYGYANFKWLKGHLKAAHDKKSNEETGVETSADKEVNEGNADDTTIKVENLSSPIATRTRSAIKKGPECELTKEPSETQDEEPKNEAQKMETTASDFIMKTEVKQECLDSSDDEIWIVQTADEEAEQQLQKILVAAKNDKEESSSKHVCSVCQASFVCVDSLTSHKCRRPRRRAREPGIRVPTKEDFMKRAQGRPRLDDSVDNDLLTVRPRKRRNRPPTSDPQIVTCHNCNESFTSKVRLKFHMQFHDSTSMLSSGQYKCAECACATFATETALFDHVHFQHKQKRWQCPVKGCGKTFYLRATLTKHSRTHTDTRRYACSTCGKRFLDKQTLDEHGVTHLQIKPFQCHICLKQLTRRSRLRMHLRAHEEELCPRLVLVCAVCTRAFRDHQAAQEHITRSPECIQQFANELKEESEAVTVQLSPTSGLLKHTVQVIESPKLSKPIRRQVSGPLAEALLTQVADEARTIIRVVEIEKAFRCEYCEEVFYSESGLNSHRVIHKGIKNPFTCHICKVSFATYSRCTTHKTTHGFYKRSLADAKKQAGKSAKQEAGPSATGILGYGDFPVVKHFLCEDCGRSYLHWTYLQVHRRMKHAVESYKHKCSQCDLTCPNSWSLAMHRKKAHGDKPVVASKSDYRIPCRDCDEVLPNKTALYKHRKKEHSDGSLRNNMNPNFSCEVCETQYSSAACLEAHLQVHTGRAACAKCGHSFSTPDQLTDHLLAVHKHAGCRCPVCARVFPAPADLTAHARAAHIQNSSAGPSPRCGRLFSCARCPRRPHAALTLLEVAGLNPSPDEVMEYLAMNNIPRDKVIEITKISFPKGTTSIVPRTSRALAMLSNVPRTQIACSRIRPEIPFELFHPRRARRKAPSEAVRDDVYPITITVPPEHQPTTQVPQAEPMAYPITVNLPPHIQMADGNTATQQNPIAYPILNMEGEELTELNVQLLLRDGVLMNGNQMVQLQLNDNMLLE